MQQASTADRPADGPPNVTLPRQVDAVLIDVGFTLSVYDPDRIAAVVHALGVEVDPQRIEATQPALRHALSHSSWAFSPRGEGASRGQAFFAHLLTLAGAAAEAGALDAAAERLWQTHLADNLWSRPLPGAHEALALLRDAGLRLAVISNAEGTIDALLHRMDMRRHFEAVFDSTVVGVAKPDARIFQMALSALQVAGERAVMVGDSLKADVEGAQGAGVAAALLDPHDHHPGAQVPRFADLLAFARALVQGAMQ